MNRSRIDIQLFQIIAATHKMKFALGIGIFFLAGGIANIIMLPSPIWFTVGPGWRLPSDGFSGREIGCEEII